jgi:Tfp pilus assembly major pilin PilA
MATAPDGIEDLYRAAVGEKKADFYVPRFRAFDQPGSSKVSWNWPAFFVSFPWMLYRRMYVPALLYFVALPIALAIFGIIALLTLGEEIGSLLQTLVGLGATFVIVPMFANALYHRSVRKRIQQVIDASPSREAAEQRLIGQSSVASGGMIAVIVLVCLIPFIGILAAIAIPAYQDYTIRAQVAEGLTLAQPVKDAITASYNSSGTVPEDLQAAGFGADDVAGQYVTSIEVEEGVVFIRYGNAANPHIAGHTLSLIPQLAGEQLVWACGHAAGEYSGTSIEPKYLPAVCRQ